MLVNEKGILLFYIDRIDEPDTFCGFYPPPYSPYVIDPAAPEGHPGGGSVTELVCRKLTRFNLPTQNIEET